MHMHAAYSIASPSMQPHSQQANHDTHLLVEGVNPGLLFADEGAPEDEDAAAASRCKEDVISAGAKRYLVRCDPVPAAPSEGERYVTLAPAVMTLLPPSPER